MRYTVYEGEHSGFYYLYDTLKGEYVHRTINESVSNLMAQDLNAISAAAPAPAGVPEEVLERLMQRVTILDGLAESAERSLQEGSGEEESEVTKAKLDGYRQQARDLRVVLAPYGCIEA